MEGTTRKLLVLVSCLVMLVASAGYAQENLLANPAFEDADGWKSGWTIVDATKTGAPYVYHIGPVGGGHGTAKPYTAHMNP